MEKMVRKQTYINPQQDNALKRLARKESVTEAEIIRRAIDRYLREEQADYNPIMELIGIGKEAEEAPADGSVNHDKYIYERV